jgi:hypothetical protein
MRRSFAAAVLVLIVAATASAAQAPADSLVGRRVRFAVPQYVSGALVQGTQRPSAGTLVGIDTSSITVRMDRDSSLLTAPIGAIKDFQVSGGMMSRGQSMRRGLRHGALLGGGITAGGAALFYLGAYAADRLSKKECPLEPPEYCGLRGDKGHPSHALPIVAAGALGGAVLGVTLNVRAHERWQGVRLHPSRGRSQKRSMDVGLSLRV